MAFTIWKGHLTFGLVSIPVRLFRAARAEKIHMHHLQRKTGARVRQVFMPVEEIPAAEPSPPVALPTAALKGPQPTAAKASPPGPELLPRLPEKNIAPPVNGSPMARGIPRADLVRGFEYEPDKYVEFERSELEQFAPKASSTMEILEFVRFAEVDPVYLESSYYLAPEAAGAKPYALLFEALKKTEYAAIAEFVMHRRDQTIILRPGRQGIVGHTLFYEDEVKRENEFHADSSMIAQKEIDLAVKLVDALAAPFQPEKFKDKYRERLREAIAAKVETGAIKQVAAATRKTPVIDIMTALQESLSKLKKPAASEVEISSPKASRRRK